MSIYDALESMGIPVCHPPYKGDVQNHITYAMAGQRGTIYAEGREAETGVGWFVTVCTVGYDETVMLTAKGLLEAAGYTVTVEGEGYDSDNVYHLIELAAVKVGAEYA